MEFTIDRELESLLEQPSSIEDEQFEQLLIENGGPDESLKVWKEKGVLVDGHRRYKACQKHNLPFRVEEISFNDKEDVIRWMRRRQRFRRNLSNFARMAVDKELVAAAKAKGQGSALAAVAESTGKSMATVSRSVAVVDTVEAMRPAAKKQIESGKVKVSRRAAETLADLPEPQRKKVEAKIAAGGVKSVSEALNKSGIQVKEQSKVKVAKASADMPESCVDAFGVEVSPDLFPVFREVGEFVRLGSDLRRIANELKALGERIGCEQTSNLRNDVMELRSVVLGMRPVKAKAGTWLSASTIGMDEKGKVASSG